MADDGNASPEEETPLAANPWNYRDLRPAEIP